MTLNGLYSSQAVKRGNFEPQRSQWLLHNTLSTASRMQGKLNSGMITYFLSESCLFLYRWKREKSLWLFLKRRIRSKNSVKHFFKFVISMNVKIYLKLSVWTYVRLWLFFLVTITPSNQKIPYTVRNILCLDSVAGPGYFHAHTQTYHSYFALLFW